MRGLKMAGRSSESGLEAFITFFYPVLCQICRRDRATAAEGYVCEKCAGGIRRLNPPFCRRCGMPFDGDITSPFECENCRHVRLYFEYARSAVLAKGLVLEVIHKYKYQRALWFENFLARLLLEKAARRLCADDWDLIVPVPLYGVKERERGFNQAVRIAFHLSRSTQIPHDSALLVRDNPTETQTLLTRAERSANVKNAFSLRRKRVLDGARIILVDDVFTTGATTNACARVLKNNGASAVVVWTVARGV
ncbi:MAG: ComF family protein [Verrucomicrobia bacterium]|nr:ComF family protein [Verrucomicrobiota bacterium]